MDRGALAELGFTRLAGAKGDITAEVIERYYRACPDARASFIHHGLGNAPELEGRMVSETAFLLMRWAADPSAAKIEQGTTICHHQDTLEVGPQWYIGLIDAVLETLLECIPAEAGDELAMWIEVRSEISDFIESIRHEFWRKDHSGPLPAFPATENA